MSTSIVLSGPYNCLRMLSAGRMQPCSCGGSSCGCMEDRAPTTSHSRTCIALTSLHQLGWQWSRMARCGPRGLKVAGSTWQQGPKRVMHSCPHSRPPRLPKWMASPCMNACRPVRCSSWPAGLPAQSSGHCVVKRCSCSPHSGCPVCHCARPLQAASPTVPGAAPSMPASHAWSRTALPCWPLALSHRYAAGPGRAPRHGCGCRYTAPQR
jgi:hypothetical protein